MLSRSHITTIGSAVRDIFIFTDAGVVISNPKDMLCSDLVAFERAAKTEVQSLLVAHGGGAANTAVTFARLGLKPMILAAVGNDDAGLDLRVHLQHEGVSLRYLQQLPHMQTGTTIIVNVADTESHMALVYRGASARLHITPSLLRRVMTPWVYLSALGGTWRKDLSAIMTHIRHHNIKVAWNPGGQQISAGLAAIRRYLPTVEVFMVNYDEALELANSATLIQKKSSPRILARLLGQYGARYTVVTDGHRGAYAYFDRQVYYQKAILGKTVNKTGAGDAFGAGFVAGLIHSMDVRNALKLAAYNSHSVVGRIGAQVGILRKKDLRRLHII